MDCSLIITPNRRLAERKLTEYDKLQKTNNEVWNSPAIYSLSDWLNLLWGQAETCAYVDKILLTSQLELIKIEQIIENSEFSKSLLRLHSTAKLVLNANNIINGWLFDKNFSCSDDNQDQQAFQSWRQQYIKWQSENKYIGASQLPQELKKLVSSKLFVPKNITFFGFEEIIPSVKSFIDCLGDNGWKINYQQPEPIKSASLDRKQFASLDDELTCIAAWAKQQLARGNNYIAIVAPELPAIRGDIEQKFIDTFNPIAVCEPIKHINENFNISAAIPFNKYPIISVLMKALRLMTSKMAAEDIAYCLRSPFFAYNYQIDANTAKLADFILDTYQELDLSTLIKIISEVSSQDNNLAVMFKGLQQHIPDRLDHSYGYWLAWLQDFIKMINWPGTRPLSSVEHQAVKRWLVFLNEILSLELLNCKISFSKFLSVLNKLIADIPFQAENRNASIQVLGILEASGQQFDCIWVLGCNNEAWPHLAAPNPFININIQRQYQLPHSSADREYQYSKSVTSSLRTSAKEVIFSHSQMLDNRQLIVSELIKDIGLSLEQTKEPLIAVEKMLENVTLNQIVNDKGPKLKVPKAFKGGSSALNYYLECPFKSFAAFRLGITDRYKYQLGFNYAEKGVLIHKVLELFWKQIKTQNNLKKLSVNDLTDKVNEIVDKVVAKSIKSCDSDSANISDLIQDVEKIRLTNLIVDYLQLELKRKPFTVIATEITKNIQIGSLAVKLRLDRIDETCDGEQIVIDYKTGNFNAADIGKIPVQNLQLPLYWKAVEHNNPNGIIVAKIHAKQNEYIGISNKDLEIQGVENINSNESTDNWQQLVSTWTEQLEQISANFVNGVATIQPIAKEQSCARCNFAGLCRISEQ